MIRKLQIEEATNVKLHDIVVQVMTIVRAHVFQNLFCDTVVCLAAISDLLDIANNIFLKIPPKAENFGKLNFLYRKSHVS